MCGIAGVLGPRNLDDPKCIESMLDKIVHRGPDDRGVWRCKNLSLGHQRLSILDLSSSGKQPMESSSGRFVIVFNGEIYNYEELRLMLPAINYRGSSDTEVALQAFEYFGIEKSLELFNGMFALALWDRRDKVLTLARDRFGEKPLYFGVLDNNFVFASEISCIESNFGEQLTISHSSLAKQAAVSYIPAPNSIYNEINKLTPGCYIQYKDGELSNLNRYWALSESVSKGKANQFVDSREAIDSLHTALKKSVKLRMASDVPLGAFLSGGTDSTVISALMQAQSDEPINTFSIGFDVENYNEAVFAKQVAEHLGTKHHERYFSSKEVLDIVPRLGSMFDEPFSDASQMPTFLVSNMAKEKVTVALTGDGGDELFCGYQRYQAADKIWGKIKYLPFRSFIAKSIDRCPTNVLNFMFFFLQNSANRLGRKGAVGKKLKTLANWLDRGTAEEFYQQLLVHWKLSDNLFVRELSLSDLDFLARGIGEFDEFFEWMMFLDSTTYLSGDILTKVDRTAMNVSLEGRIPLLDPNVVDIAWQLPISMRQNGSIGKWALKEVLYKYVPKEIMERPKMGFGVPIASWLKNELKEWAQDLLSYDRLRRQKLYNPEVVTDTLNSHLSNKEDNSAKLWDILMVQAWLDADKRREKRI